jgi:hypothetical protein
MPGMYMEGNKRVKCFPLKSISGFGKKKQRKNKENCKKIKKKFWLSIRPRF